MWWKAMSHEGDSSFWNPVLATVNRHDSSITLRSQQLQDCYPQIFTVGCSGKGDVRVSWTSHVYKKNRMEHENPSGAQFLNMV